MPVFFEKRFGCLKQTSTFALPKAKAAGKFFEIRKQLGSFRSKFRVDSAGRG